VGINCKELVDRANNGQHALDLIKKDIQNNHDGIGSSYKLILMDCNMPMMDGCQATNLIREHLYSCNIAQPIITAVTGHSEQSYVQKCL
jgi:CheY-like chemotaxis protein